MFPNKKSLTSNLYAAARNDNLHMIHRVMSKNTNLYKDYTLCSVPTISFNNLMSIDDDKIYICAPTRRYIYRDHKRCVKFGKFPDGIDLKDLSSKLYDEDLKERLLYITSKGSQSLHKAIGYGTPLEWAIRFGKRHVVDSLISYGADINSTCAVSRAVQFGRYNIDHLTHRHGCKVDAETLISAVFFGEVDLVDHLVQAYGFNIHERFVYSFDFKSNKRLVSGTTYLMLANVHYFSLTDARITQHLVHHYGLDVNATNDDGNTALMLICRYMHQTNQFSGVKIIRFLLESGADVHIQNNKGKTAAIIAAKIAAKYELFALRQMAHELRLWEIKHPPKLAAVSNDLPVEPIHSTACTSESNPPSTTIKLMESANARVQQNLFKAARKGNNDLIATAIDLGADVNKANSIGDTALLLAAYHGHMTSIDYLVCCSANLHTINHDGDTALLLAAQRGHSDIIDHLVNLGLNVHAKNKNGDTALILALHHGYIATALHLVSHHRLNIHTENNEGITAVTIATERELHKLLAKLLQLDTQVQVSSHAIPTSSSSPAAPVVLPLYQRRSSNTSALSSSGFCPPPMPSYRPTMPSTGPFTTGSELFRPVSGPSISEHVTNAHSKKHPR